MIKLTKIHEPDQTWIVRLCMSVDDVAEPVEGSVRRPCDECGRLVWYDVNQPIPEVPGVTFDGEVAICTACFVVHEAYGREPAKFVGPTPWDVS